MFGLRHAVDADHIAAIDNVVRKLMQEGRKPLTVGFWFSLGHSSIVIIASAIIAASAAALQGQLDALHEVGGVVGTLVSAFFLLAIGLANLLVLRGIWAAFARAKLLARSFILDEDLSTRCSPTAGFLARIFRRVFGVVRRSWHMYPVGFPVRARLRGTATHRDRAPRHLRDAGHASGMSFWSIMVFPALFTAGDGAGRHHRTAWRWWAPMRWAFVNPIRKLWYNLTITAASVAVAIFVGGIEALGLLSGQRLSLTGGIWDVIGNLNGNLYQPWLRSCRGVPPSVGSSRR